MLEALLDEPEGVTVIVTSTPPESVVMVLCAGAEVEGVDACGALVAEVEVVDQADSGTSRYPKSRPAVPPRKISVGGEREASFLELSSTVKAHPL